MGGRESGASARQASYNKEVKEQAPPNEEHITVKKISEKDKQHGRRQRQCKSAWDRGLGREDNEASINDGVEQMCLFFWWLEEIW